MMQNSSWFFEENGKMTGPYSSREILDFIMSGRLKVEAKIFSAEKNSWQIAADVIPQLEIDATSMIARPVQANANRAPLSNNWAPPPRPKDLKDVHVVDIASNNSTSQIDYFELINTKIKAKTPKESKFLNENSDWSEDLATATAAFQKVNMLLKEYRRAFTTAAALAIVFSGTYYTIKSMSNHNMRVPAGTGKNNGAEFEHHTQGNEVSENGSDKSAVASAGSDANSMQMQSGSSIGSGKNRIIHRSGGVTHQITSAPPSNMQPQQAENQNNSTQQAEQASQTEPPRDNGNSQSSPQYYSSSVDENGVERDIANTNPEQLMPTDGAVNPPDFSDQNQQQGNVPAQPVDPNQPGF